MSDKYRLPETLYDKLWNAHVVTQQAGHPAVLYVDLHLLHDGTYRRAFQMLAERGLKVERPQATVAVVDHCIPSHSSFTAASLRGKKNVYVDVVSGLIDVCQVHGIRVYKPGDANQGIVHVIGPELGLTQPGMTVACADSHTTTHGALGALGLAIGTTQVLHVLASQCVLQRKASNLNIRVEGVLSPGTSAKDLVLAILSVHGTMLGVGQAIEFSGSTVRAMSMEQRMTLCNMGAELSARAALIAPDQVTFDYLRGREFSPAGKSWEEACNRWSLFCTDEGGQFDVTIDVDASLISPMVTYGTSPDMGVEISGVVPDPEDVPSEERRKALVIALEYMGLRPGDSVTSLPVNVVFIGSCTNSRIEDIRAAASVLCQGKVAEGVRLLVVPGSEKIKRQAEVEGLDQVVIQSGGEWGEPGCSLCVGMNDELVAPGKYVASTSNRNFQGRQGPGARTLLMSPITAAASALNGRVTDPRRYAVI
jgi:3-isopropylmalate/(R)-2-methylmalate dehydratase large subunit